MRCCALCTVCSALCVFAEWQSLCCCVFFQLFCFYSIFEKYINHSSILFAHTHDAEIFATRDHCDRALHASSLSLSVSHMVSERCARTLTLCLAFNYCLKRFMMSVCLYVRTAVHTHTNTTGLYIRNVVFFFIPSLLLSSSSWSSLSLSSSSSSSSFFYSMLWMRRLCGRF